MPLNKLKNLIVPQDSVFFDLMEKQAKTAHAASQELSALMQDYRGVQEKSKKIRELEHRGDELMRDVYGALNRTFIVPIDHADISTLASSLDDVLDLTDHTANLFVMYEIEAPTPAMVEMAGILASQTGELRSAVAAINNSRTYAKVPAHCNEIKRLEMTADGIYNQAVAALFKKKDAILT